MLIEAHTNGYADDGERTGAELSQERAERIKTDIMKIVKTDELNFPGCPPEKDRFLTVGKGGVDPVHPKSGDVDDLSKDNLSKQYANMRGSIRIINAHEVEKYNDGALLLNREDLAAPPQAAQDIGIMKYGNSHRESFKNIFEKVQQSKGIDVALDFGKNTITVDGQSPAITFRANQADPKDKSSQNIIDAIGLLIFQMDLYVKTYNEAVDNKPIYEEITQTMTKKVFENKPGEEPVSLADMEKSLENTRNTTMQPTKLSSASGDEEEEDQKVPDLVKGFFPGCAIETVKMFSPKTGAKLQSYYMVYKKQPNWLRSAVNALCSLVLGLAFTAIIIEEIEPRYESYAKLPDWAIAPIVGAGPLALWALGKMFEVVQNKMEDKAKDKMEKMNKKYEDM